MSEKRELRFRRGATDIAQFLSRHSARPVDDKAVYRMHYRGTLRLGRDGSTLVGEETEMLKDLSRVALPKTAPHKSLRPK
jgi:hypothetical protein